MSATLRIGAIIALLLLSGWGTYAQTQRSQEIINADTAWQIQSMDRRISEIEKIHPDTILLRLQNLEERASDQQRLLWGIIAAVIINILTPAFRWPLGKRAESR